MSQENVEMVRQCYDAWNRDDFQWVLDRCASDIEFRPNADFADLDHVYRGRQGVAAWYGRWRDAWDALSYQVERIEALDDRVLVLVVITGQGRGSGVIVQDQRGHLFTVEAGLCARFQSFGTWDDALEAVGLAE